MRVQFGVTTHMLCVQFSVTTHMPYSRVRSMWCDHTHAILAYACSSVRPHTCHTCVWMDYLSARSSVRSPTFHARVYVNCSAPTHMPYLCVDGIECDHPHAVPVCVCSMQCDHTHAILAYACSSLRPRTRHACVWMEYAYVCSSVSM